MKTHLLLTTLALALAARCPLRSQALPEAKPESVGLSPERLARIGAAVQRDVDQKNIAGVVTLVARHGKVAWFDARGSADREAGKPMQKDTIFRICSMSKPLTSTAVMILLEEGRFLLEDPVSKYLPEFKNPKVLVTPEQGEPYTIPAKREITILDLLRHTSGLTYNWDPKLGQLYRDAHVSSGLEPYKGTIADNVRSLAAVPLLFSPGEKWNYSLSIDVLGRLVEVVSGMPFDQFLKTRVTDPLGMKDTGFIVSDAQLPRLAAVYTYYDGKGLQRFPAAGITEGPFSYTDDYVLKGHTLFSGGAGLFSTAGDYARFCQMFLNGGELDGVRILSRKSVELMTHDTLGKIGPEQGFGIGFGISGVKAPLTELGSPGQYGWGGFYDTLFTIDPKEDMIVIALAQLHPTGGDVIEAVVQNLAYQAIAD